MKELNAQHAYNYLVYLLSKRDYSEYKLRQKLKLKGYDPADADQAINEVIEQRYLREENYIEARIKGFMYKNCSPRYIQQKMAQEKLTVSMDLIEEIFLEYHYEVDDQVDALIQKKLPRFLEEELEWEARQKLKQKIYNYIRGKGHSNSKYLGQIDQAINDLVESSSI